MSETAVRHADADDLGQLLAWIGALTGGTVLGSERLPTVRPAWKVSVRGADGSDTPYVLRCARPGGFGLADVYTLPREAAVVRALAGTNLPVPKVIGMHAAPEAMLLEFMPGQGDFAALQAEPDHKAGVVDHFMDLLAELHTATPASLDLGGALEWPATPQAHALLELDIWEKLYRDAARSDDELLLFALYWLRRNAPAATRTVLVQGDTGPNQCLFDNGRITAVLDWELAHFGDPMEDLGWMAARSFFMHFGDLRQLFARYSERSGIALDRPRIHYYRIMALVKCAIATGLARAAMGPEDDIASIVSWDAVNRLALAISFMDTLHRERVPPSLAPAAAVTDPLYPLLAQVLRGDAERAPGVYERNRRHGLAQLVDYLAAAAAQEQQLGAIDTAERRAVCDRCGGADNLAALIDRREPAHDAALATYFYRREYRHIALLERGLGIRVQCLVENID